MMIQRSVISFVILTLTTFQLVNAQSRCYNPNRRNGVCISIYDCPSLYAILERKPLSPDDRRFLVESQCTGGSGRSPHVCCNEDTGFVRITTTSTPRTPPPRETTAAPSNGRGNVLPSPPACGVEPSGNKIYNGNDTAIDEYPWMVLLEYRTRTGQKVLNCGGSLINHRYVITAAHCVTGATIRESGPLVSVRLGEYDITQEVDCVEGDCNHPVVTTGVEEVIMHEDYVDGSQSRHNDIALIRLNRDVQSTDFIKPVCLPSSVGLKRLQPDSELIVAGWGRTLLTRQSSIKQKLSIPVWDQNSCRTMFRPKQVEIVESQICAGGRFAEDSCDGDSGGPLMGASRNYWALVGVVSFGNKCGLENWPAVYTRVSSYENWINENMRP